MPLTLLYRVFYREGSKILCFGSDVTVKNNTIIPLRMALDLSQLPTSTLSSSSLGTTTQQLIELPSLAPGASTSLPIARTRSNCILRFRPEGFAYDWSDAELRCGSLAVGCVKGTLRCASRDAKLADSPSWQYGLEITGERIARRGKFGTVQPLSLTLHTPLVLENRLPCDLRYRVEDRKLGRTTAGHIAPGENMDIFQRGSKGVHSALSVMVPGFDWSEPMTLTSGDHKVALHRPDKESRQPLSLMLSCLQTSYSAVTCTVYAQYWIFNKTDTKLIYSHDGKANASEQDFPPPAIKVAAAAATSSSSSSSSSSMTSTTATSSTDTSIQTSPTVPSRAESSEAELQLETQAELMAPWIFSEPKLFIKKNKSRFSNNIPLVSASGVIDIPDEPAPGESASSHMYQLAANIGAAPGRYYRTSLIVLQPRFIVANKLEQLILIRQQKAKEMVGGIALGTDQQMSFDWANVNAPKRLEMRIDDEYSSWSPAIDIAAPGSVQFRIRRNDGTSQLVRVSVSVQDSTSMVVFLTPKFPQYRVDNHSSRTMTVSQQGGSLAPETVVSEQSLVFTWETPSDKRNRLLLNVAHTDQRCSIDLDTIHTLDPIALPARALASSTPAVSGGAAVTEKSNPTHLGMVVKAVGPTKVLELFDIFDIEKYREMTRKTAAMEAKQAIGEAALDEAANRAAAAAAAEEEGSSQGASSSSSSSLSSSTTAAPTPPATPAVAPTPAASTSSLASSTSSANRLASMVASSSLDMSTSYSRDTTSEGAEQPEAASAPKLQMTAQISFPGIGLSIVDESPRELLYLLIRGLHVTYMDYDTNTALEFKVEHLQIDNQLYLSPYPIMFYSVPAPNQSFVHISLSKSKQYTDITYLYFFEILVQEMEIMVDEELLLSLLKFADAATSYLRQQRDLELESKVFVNTKLNALSADIGGEADLIYIGWLTINTFILRLSFLTTGLPDSSTNPGYLEKLLRTGGFLANIDSAPICLNGLSIRHPFHSSSELIGIISQHYISAGLHEVHKILGSADILGNPVSLVSNLGTGVYDFFNEPKEGLVTSPAEFAKGIASIDYVCRQ